jgi:hypothetical protein
MNALMRWIERLTGATDRKAEALLKMAFRTAHPYPESVFALCRGFRHRVIDNLGRCGAINIDFSPCDRGDYQLRVVFDTEANLASAIASKTVDVLCTEAVELFVAHGQIPGFKVFRILACYHDIIEAYGDWDAFKSGRFDSEASIDTTTGRLIVPGRSTRSTSRDDEGSEA